MKTILCPTDFSKSSENAVNYAVEIARTFKSTIILMHAYETPVIYTDVTVSSVQLDFELLRESALKQLKKFYTKMLEHVKDVQFELILQQGLPSSRTVEIATEKKVDMIVMATTASTQVQRFLIGSNASRVIREAPCKVMLIPQKAKFNGFKKIVFSTDLSDENLIASNQVVSFGQMFKSEIIFLNVDNKNLIHDETDLTRVTHRIKQFVQYPKMRGYVCTDLNIADGISFFLKNEKADCLALATHHRKFLSALANPSITKRVSYKTDIPMLIIHLAD
ncbi:MAG: universal stress protein [Bacteroidetes bacterium]|nr:universal stress protein [Bacteroidota bacterium]